MWMAYLVVTLPHVDPAVLVDVGRLGWKGTGVSLMLSHYGNM